MKIQLREKLQNMIFFMFEVKEVKESVKGVKETKI